MLKQNALKRKADEVEAVDGALFALGCRDGSDAARALLNSLTDSPDLEGLLRTVGDELHVYVAPDDMLDWDAPPPTPITGGNRGGHASDPEYIEKNCPLLHRLPLLERACAAAGVDPAVLARAGQVSQNLDVVLDEEWIEEHLFSPPAYDPTALASQPALLTGGTLYAHQRSCLAWMLERERGSFRDDSWVSLRDHAGRRHWFAPAVGRLSVQEPPSDTCGGYLADYMGVGKTVTSLALVAHTLDDQRASRMPTLVVCPANMAKQWEREAKAWVPDARVATITTKSGGSIAAWPSEVDIVVMSVKAVCGNGAPPCYRIIVDEVHLLSSCRPLDMPCPSHAERQHTIPAVGIARTPARRRWALSGTPSWHAKPHALHSAMRVLRVPMFDNYRFVATLVSASRGSWAFAVPQLQACTLRRGADTLTGLMSGTRITRHDATLVTLAAEDRRVYDAVFDCTDNGHARRLHAAGGSFPLDTLRSGYWRRDWADLAVMLHADREEKKPRVDARVAEEVAAREDKTCAICREDPMSAPEAMTPCGHVYCAQCILSAAYGNLLGLGRPRCPMCRQEFEVSELRIAYEPPVGAAGSRSAVVATDGLQELREAVDALPVDPEAPNDRVRILSKPLAVAAKVVDICRTDESAAVVVCCHFPETVRCIVACLADRGIEAEFASAGSGSERWRTATDRFVTGAVRVFVMQFTNASGLNLTTANHVVLAEPPVNNGEREQAVGRAWRAGQRRDVHVWTLAARDTVEEELLAPPAPGQQRQWPWVRRRRHAAAASAAP